MAKKINSGLSDTIKDEIENLSKNESKLDHACFDTGKFNPYPLASIISSYIERNFPKQFYLEVKADQNGGGQIFIYKKQ